jgi:catechol O-methyltransferase
MVDILEQMKVSIGKDVAPRVGSYSLTDYMDTSQLRVFFRSTESSKRAGRSGRLVFFLHEKQPDDVVVVYKKSLVRRQVYFRMDFMKGDRQDAVRQHVLKHAKEGDLDSVVNAIDQFAWNGNWMMNIGDKKGLILDQAIKSKQPRWVLELGKDGNVLCLTLVSLSIEGTFIGYSSMRMIQQLPSDAHVVSVDPDLRATGLAREFHKLAGVTDRITIVNDYSHEAIPRLKAMFHIDAFDLIFIDHIKDAYLEDFKRMEAAGLIKQGTVIVADNVIYPGAPDYLEYIRNNPNYKNTFHEAHLEYTANVRDGVEVSIRL